MLDPVNVFPVYNALKNNDYAFMKYIWDALIYNVQKPNNEDYDMYLKESLKQRNIVDVDFALTTFNMSNFSNGLILVDNTIRDIVCPGLSIWGDKDLVVLEYMIDETVEALSNVQKVVLKDSAHSPFENKLNELIELITNFI